MTDPLQTRSPVAWRAPDPKHPGWFFYYESREADLEGAEPLYLSASASAEQEPVEDWESPEELPVEWEPVAEAEVAHPAPAPAVPDDVAGLVAALRDGRLALLGHEIHQAADALEAQAAKLAHQEYLLGRDQASRQYHIKKRRELEDDNRRLTAERDALRAELELVASDVRKIRDGQEKTGQLIEKLRIALNPKGD